MFYPTKTSLFSQLHYFCQDYEHSTSHTKSNVLGILQPYLSFRVFNQIQTNQSLIGQISRRLRVYSPMGILQPWGLSPKECKPWPGTQTVGSSAEHLDVISPNQAPHMCGRGNWIPFPRWVLHRWGRMLILSAQHLMFKHNYQRTIGNTQNLSFSKMRQMRCSGWPNVWPTSPLSGPNVLISPAAQSVACWWLTSESLSRKKVSSCLGYAPSHGVTRTLGQFDQGGMYKDSAPGLNSWQLWGGISASKILTVNCIAVQLLPLSSPVSPALFHVLFLGAVPNKTPEHKSPPQSFLGKPTLTDDLLTLKHLPSFSSQPHLPLSRFCVGLDSLFGNKISSIQGLNNLKEFLFWDKDWIPYPTSTP